MRVLISAGEASGDLYGAALIAELRRLDPSVEICGLGGERMSTEGFQEIGSSAGWGSISILQSVREGMRAINTYYRLKSTFFAGEKGVFLPIDFGYMNLRLARAAKSAGWKVVYFIPPGSWRRDRQGADIPQLADVVVTNFPWSAEILKKMGADAHFFGHPLKQIHHDILSKEHERKGIAVLPGSRRSELEQLLPTLQAGLEHTSLDATLPVPKHFQSLVTSQWSRSHDQVVNGSERGKVISTLAQSEWGIICSGTATLEAALAKTPMIVVYKVSKAVELESKIIRFKRPEFVSQPNILLGRRVVPELIQEGFTTERLQEEITRLTTEEAQAEQRLAFEEIDEMLGGNDAITRTAALVLGFKRQ